jgi:hypothetical protein
VTTLALVDVHKVPHNELILTSPTTYNSTKIGTARVRQLTQTAYSGPHKMYLYDIIMTSGDFGDVQSIVIPESPLSGAISITSKCNIDNTGKVGGTSTAGVTKIIITDGGTGYSSVPTVAVTGTATATAAITGGVVTSWW